VSFALGCSKSTSQFALSRFSAASRLALEVRYNVASFMVPIRANLAEPFIDVLIGKRPNKRRVTMKETAVARAVLLEMLHALGTIRDELVIVGGWVPDLLYRSSNRMGSLDVDEAVTPKAIGGGAYSSIHYWFQRVYFSMGQLSHLSWSLKLTVTMH